jgi:post-segregation antitoxin (ccd killing protein)
MELTVQIPDDLASRMRVSGGDLSRRALEALALEEFKGGHITKRLSGNN